MKNISIIMPSVYIGIAGGYKVIFDYANYLSNNDYKVKIYFDTQGGKNSHHVPSIFCFLLRKLFLKRYYKLYNLNKEINLIPLKYLIPECIQSADCIIATSPNITYFVDSLDKSKGHKFEFVQGYENWDGTSDKYIKDSYSLMNNIVVSKWLKELVDENSCQKSYLVQNGIDTDFYTIKRDISNRFPHSICMIYNEGENKGCKYAIDAINAIKEIYSDTIVELAGTPKRPKDLPKWIKYKQMATNIEMVEIYNNNAIFICPSIVEGFGLPGLEAMSCGCALITTNCFGPMEYANDTNSIICESKSEDAIFLSIKELFENDTKRKQIALNALKVAKKFNINRSRRLFEECLNEK